MADEKIKIITCGGTFEKVYDPITGNLTFKDSHITDLIKRSRITKTVIFENIMLVDSLDMTEKNRKTIAENIRESQEDRILVIHGTDTMVRTSNEITKHKRIKQTVVITGAMIPYSLKNSDAFFNFGYAIAALQLLEPQVWIAMNGRIFRHHEVEKNTVEGIFQKNTTLLTDTKT